MIPVLPGTLVKAISPGLWPHHLGIVAGSGPDGTLVMIHSRERGVEVTSFEDFAHGRPIDIVATPYSVEHQRAVLERACSQIGRPFSLVFANCEHFSNWAFYGVPRSPQLGQYAVGLLLTGLVFGALATERPQHRN
jgi:lecithin:retinol acyltransferase